MDNTENIKENWLAIKETIRREYNISDISYQTWLDPLTFFNIVNDVVNIIIPSDQAHALNYISSKYKSFFQVTITEMFNHNYDIKFILEKDTAYQRIGHYLVPAQVIERNLHRSFLRFQTDETGVVSLTSIYCGSYNIHHTAVKVTAPDGNFTETSVSRDSYETTDLGEHIEKADYKLGEDGGVIAFVAANKDKNLRVDYKGERSYTTHMLPADRQAASDIYELGKTLSAITEIKKNIEEANLKIQFIQKKMTERKTETE